MAQVTSCKWEEAFPVCLEEGEHVLWVALALPCLPRVPSCAMALEDVVC